MADKYRVQLDFTAEAFQELESLKTRLGAASRAEAVRYGLAALRWLFSQLSSGATILVEKDGVQQQVVFPFLHVVQPAPRKA